MCPYGACIEDGIYSKKNGASNFSHDALINSEIEERKWVELVSCDETIDKIAQQTTMTCNLDKYVSDRLEFYYVTKVGSNRNTKDVVLERSDSMKDKKIRTHDDKSVPARDLILTDLKLHVRNEYMDTIEED